MRLELLIATAIALLLSACASTPNPTLVAAASTTAYLSVPPVALNLGAPPAANSAEAAADLATVLSIQASRTPDRVAQAQADAQLDPFLTFQPVLGADFTAANAPAFNRLSARMLRDVGAAGRGPKQQYDRPRPPRTDPAVTPCVPVPEGGGHSFPSGHATLGRVLGLVLAEMIPTQADALRARGDDYGHSRLVCGVHFPSDVAAGQRLGDAVFTALMADTGFLADLELARRELAKFDR
jgi:acid phosphatase (class A)